MTGRWRALVFGLPLALAAVPAAAQTPLALAATNWYAAHPAEADMQTAATAAGNGPSRKDDGHFPVVLGAFLTASSADLAVSMYQIGRGAAREAAFGSGWEHAPVAFALSKSGAAALFAIGVQKMHKDRPKAALVVGVSATIVESLLVVRAARISPSP